MDFLTGGGRIGRLRFILVGALLAASAALTGQWTTYIHPVTDEFVIEPAGYAVAVACVGFAWWVRRRASTPMLGRRAGVVGLVVGGVFTGLTASKKSDATNACNANKQCTPDQFAFVEDANTFADVSTVAWIVGGVFTAGGVIIIALGGSSTDSKDSALRLSPFVGSGVGLSVGGTL